MVVISIQAYTYCSYTRIQRALPCRPVRVGRLCATEKWACTTCGRGACDARFFAETIRSPVSTTTIDVIGSASFSSSWLRYEEERKKGQN